ncbi:MAG: HDOD domain-containing protein, partial [Pseudomonadaceae bacterium]|nr:HDOD domain-containing protein [Pseudomonadaceae bacterium]
AAAIDCFGDVASAYAGWQRSQYQLVLADWNLPDDSGLSLLQLIRKQDKDVPLVMITARADRDSVLAARPLTVSAYITKPFEVPKVLECLERLLPEDSTVKTPEQSVDDLENFLASRSAADLDLPMLARVKDSLMQVSSGAPLDFRELTADWQHDPALCAYLISAANSPAYVADGQRCTSLADALKRLGGRTSLNLAIGLALRQACGEEDPLLFALVQEHLDAAERVAEKVVQLARQCGVEHGTLQVAALLHRMGELCVLLQVQAWVRQGNRLDDNAVAQALERHARPFAIALKAQWGLPMSLRELIGAAYELPRIQVRREQALIRLAAALCGSEPAQTLERLRRLAGVD